MAWYSIFPKYPNNWNEISERVKKRDGYRCTVCGRSSSPDNRLHACHKVSKSNGGTDDDDNLITKCEECHSNEPKHGHLKALLRRRVPKVVNISPL